MSDARVDDFTSCFAAQGWRAELVVNEPSLVVWRMVFTTTSGLVSAVLQLDAAADWAVFWLSPGIEVPVARRDALGHFVLAASFGLQRGGFEFDRSTGEVRFRVGLPVEAVEGAADRWLQQVRPAVASFQRLLPGVLAVARHSSAPEDALASVRSPG